MDFWFSFFLFMVFLEGELKGGEITMAENTNYSENHCYLSLLWWFWYGSIRDGTQYPPNNRRNIGGTPTCEVPNLRWRLAIIEAESYYPLNCFWLINEYKSTNQSNCIRQDVAKRSIFITTLNSNVSPHWVSFFSWFPLRNSHSMSVF